MMNPLDLTGHTVLVTGASAGIGQGTAVLLSQLNAKVICVGRSAEGLAATKARMTDEGHSFVQFDLAAIDEIPGWMKSLAVEGPLHGLVHCAGVNEDRPLKHLNRQDYSAMMTINLEAAVALAKGFRQRAVCPEGGSVVLISSTAAIKGGASIAVYSASKGALLSLARALARELARDRIRINCLCPGLINSRMAEKYLATLTPEAIERLKSAYPLGLAGRAEDVGYAAAFFLSDASRWITGTSLVIDGGFTA